MRFGYWLSTIVLKFYFKLFHRHKVVGLENIPKGAAIIAPNHLSLYDPPLICCSISEELHFLAKHELFTPILGRVIRYHNAHPVSGSEKDLQTMKLICQLLQEGDKVVIFPEGRRSHTGKLLELKMGVSMLAIRNNVPVVPIFLSGTFEIWPMHQLFPKFFGKTFCRIGNPIYPEEFSKMGKREAQLALTQAIHKSLKEMQDTPLEEKEQDKQKKNETGMR